MSKRDVKYTSRTLTSMIHEAVSLGVQVYYHVDMEGKYIVSHKVVSKVPGRDDLATERIDIYTPDTVAMAHWLLWGMIAQAKNQLCGILALQNNNL
jgi:hypothetical protein